jgi:XRE family transcriptional regulator, master regulator for biofilm formation
MLGERIRQQRIEKGISLTQFAKQSGISKSYLSNLERGLQQNPSIEVLKKISEYLNVDIEILINEIGITKQNKEDYQ